jgi:DNA-directed RNA polymerase sigma subunit (sigma70/sigma32)
MLGRNAAETAELELGKRLAECLTPLKSQHAVARELGISREAVRRIERRALAKIAIKLKEIANVERA